MRFALLALMLSCSDAEPPPVDSAPADPPADSSPDDTADTALPDDTGADDTGDTGVPAPGACQTGQSFEHFITRDGDRLMEGEDVYRFVSINVPNLHVVEDPAWHLPDPWEQADALCAVQQMGGRVTRTYVLSAGDSGAALPRHVTGPGEFSEELFVALDHALAQAQDHGIRVILPFVDQWTWWGGIADYAAWRGLEPDDFWTDPQVIADFKETIRFTLERTNTVTGAAYRDDPTILAWETGNELDAPPEWTAEIAAYIKSLAPDHLVMDGAYGVELASLDDPNVDIVSNHYYWPPGYWDDYAAAARADLALSEGARPLFLGEFGFVETARVEALYDVVAEEPGVAGAMIWSLRFHDADGGYYWHTEIDDGDALYRAYHWPGFDSGDAYDERTVLELTRAYAWRVRGEDPPDLPPPDPPTILSADGAQIAWRGSTGAASYSLERADDPAGPWAEVAAGFHDAVTANTAAVIDPSAAEGASYHYRLLAHNAYGASDPSDSFGPVTIPATLLDPLDSADHMASLDANLGFDTANTGYFEGDAGRLYRTAAGDGSATWQLPGEVTAIRARVYHWPWEARGEIAISTSDDGVDFTPTSLAASEIGGDWARVDYTASGGGRWVRLTLLDHGGEVWNPQLGQIEIDYGPE